MSGLVWINGEVGALDAATVSLEDRGFVFGDGVYEVVRTYAGKPFELDAHMARLTRSAAGIELDLPMPAEAIGRLALDLAERAGVADAELYIQLTRGVARRLHVFPEDAPPTLVVWARELRAPAAELRESGVAAITHPDERWARCDLKTICLLPNVLAKQHAKRAGAWEALLVRAGCLTEGASTNVALVREGRLVTPIADQRILPGVTRAVVLRLAREAGLPVEERDVAASELADADEVFLMSTTAEVLPVVTVDGRPVGTGRPGPVTRELARALRALS